ncbi:MAG: uroporphyrinogen decarboxylase family protein [Candidatus Lokiarchaeota archaeon]|nr:uroporphyrinogen decarboxylase family protein [Candidatus Harpocratesius repetitus]
MERIFAAVQCHDLDRIPFILNLTHHGAKILNLSIKEYYSKSEYMIEGQKRLWKQYRDDAVIGISYFAAEFKAWGGKIKFFSDGPPNSMRPILSNPNSIISIEPPQIDEIPEFIETLKTIKGLHEYFGDSVPVVGGILSPFSFPIMRMGFNKYIELLYQDLSTFEDLMKKNIKYAIDWANRQIEAGATMIIYFDPMSSPFIIPKSKFIETGYQIAKEILPKIKAPIVYHFASSRCQEVLPELLQLPISGVGISKQDKIKESLKIVDKKVALVGNLSGIHLVHATPAQVIKELKALMSLISPGKGFIVSDHHGEIPYFVSDEILSTISHFFHHSAKYPLN